MNGIFCQILDYPYLILYFTSAWLKDVLYQKCSLFCKLLVPPSSTWIKLYKEEPYDLYSLSDSVWMIKSRRLRFLGHVASLEGKGNRGFL